MSTWILIANLIEASIWIGAGLALLLFGRRPDSGLRSYQVAKRFMALAVIGGGASILLALWVGKFKSNQVEVLSICSLICFYVVSVCYICAFTRLYSVKRMSGKVRAWIFLPTLSIVLIYLWVAKFWGPDQIYSFDEFGMELRTSPALALRVLILMSSLLGIGMASHQYMLARHSYRKALSNYFAGEAEVRHSRWIDLFFFGLLVAALLAVGSYFVPSLFYGVAFGCFTTGLVLVLTIKMINYRKYFIRVAPALQFAQDTLPTGDSPANATTGILLLQWIQLPEKPFIRRGLSLLDLSEMTGVDARRLADYIQCCYGMNFQRWIDSLRVKEAERFLGKMASDDLLGDVATRCGFLDFTEMDRAFGVIKELSVMKYYHALKKDN